MKQLKITDEIVRILDNVFETIKPLYFSNEFNYNKEAVYIEKLRAVYTEILTVNIDDIKMEIWGSTSKIDRIANIRNLLNSKFESTVKWKQNAPTIPTLNDDLSNDVNKYIVKHADMFQTYTPQQKENILWFYHRIGHRIFKANADVRNLMKLFEKMDKDELQQFEPANINEEVLVSTNNNIKLRETKKVEFAAVVVDLYNNNFFGSIDKSVAISQDNILSAFADFLHTELEYTQPTNIGNSSNALEVESEDAKPFQDYLLHENRKRLADEFKKEFSTEKAKPLRIVLKAMELYNPPLITIGKGKGKEIYTTLAVFLDRDIGTYQGVIGSNISSKGDQSDIDSATLRLNHILKMIDNG